jgi:nitrate/nitrite transporter NarK
MGGVLVGFTLPVIMENVGWAYAASWVWACLLATALCLIPARKTIDQALCATSHSKNQQAQEKGLKIILNDRNLLLMAAASFTFSAMQVSLSVFLVTYLTTELSYSVYTAGITLSFCQICGVTGRIFFGWLADQWGNARTVQIFIALLTSLIAGVASFVSPDWPYWAVFILLMFFGALSLGWNGVYLAEVARLAPKGTEGLVTGAALAFTFAGVVFGPPLFGGIVQWQGYSLAFQVMAGLVFTGACLVIKVQKKS